jgi:hypothetical protein
MAERQGVIDATQQTAAKVAGLAYLIPVAFVVYAQFGIRGPLVVSGDTAESVRRIAAALPLFRLSAAFDVVYCVGVVVLLSALYVVLRPVNRSVTLLATLLKLVYAVTAMLMVLDLLTIARLVSSPAYTQLLGADHLQALVKLNMASAADEYYVGLVFWAVSATLIGWLWLESGYIPRALALFGLVSAAWCALCAIAYMISPAFSGLVNLWWFDSPLAIFDIVLSFWLLFRGLRGVGTPGGTELPLLLSAPDIDGVPVLDTTALHVDPIVERLA